MPSPCTHQAYIFPIQKQKQKPNWTITCLTQMCLWRPGPWAVPTTIGVVPLPCFACPVCICWGSGGLPRTPQLSAVWYQYTPPLFSGHTPEKHPPTMDRSMSSPAPTLAYASSPSGRRHECEIPQDAPKPSRKGPKFCCHIVGWLVLPPCRK